jgi:hypothetical protein
MRCWPVLRVLSRRLGGGGQGAAKAVRRAWGWVISLAQGLAGSILRSWRRPVRVRCLATARMRSQSRKPQAIGTIHKQPQPRSENPWVCGRCFLCQVPPCRVVGIMAGHGALSVWGTSRCVVLRCAAALGESQYGRSVEDLGILAARWSAAALGRSLNSRSRPGVESGPGWVITCGWPSRVLA